MPTRPSAHHPGLRPRDSWPGMQVQGRCEGPKGSHLLGTPGEVLALEQEALQRQAGIGSPGPAAERPRAWGRMDGLPDLKTTRGGTGAAPGLLPTSTRDWQGAARTDKSWTRATVGC